MSLLQKPPEHSFFLEKCERLLDEDEIRFVGVIDSMGRLVARDFKDGIIPLEDNEEMQKMYTELALCASMRKEFDYCLGAIKYCASRREKVVMMSFPINNNVLLISAETYVDIDKTARKIMKIVDI